MGVEQTVADLAYFIEFIQNLYSNTQNARVILFGKSTGAAIAVWARQKYPFLVDGVLASSASLLSAVNNEGRF
jgi:lysosomal Pro-X carboxypeptidase